MVMPWAVNECGRRGATGAGRKFLVFIGCVTRSSLGALGQGCPISHIGSIQRIARTGGVAPDRYRPETPIVYLQLADETIRLISPSGRGKSPGLGAQVSDPNSGAASSLSARPSISARYRWAALAFVAVVLIAGFLLVRNLGGVSGDSSKQASIELNWSSTMENLGVAPVFPPEEDLVVGDVLAVIIRDADIESHDPGNPVSKRALITRAVKLAHVDDVGDMLEKAYAHLPVFPDKATTAKLRDSVARKFADAVLLEDLPRAAFPRLKIQGVSSAGAGIGVDGKGSANYAAGSQQVEEFELSEVRTYGLPSVAAQQIFDEYCGNNPDVCKEATARKHLERVIGVEDRINQKVQNKKSGDFEFAMEIEILMVYRVYLTGSIVDLRRTAESQTGGLMAFWPFRSTQEAAPAAPAAVAAASPPAVPGDLAGQVTALNNRLTEIQQNLDHMKNAAAFNYRSSSGNESSLEGKFTRPVAIGYRSVKHDLSAAKPSQP